MIKGKRISKNRDLGNKSNDLSPSTISGLLFLIIAPIIIPIMIIMPVKAYNNDLIQHEHDNNGYYT